MFRLCCGGNGAPKKKAAATLPSSSAARPLTAAAAAVGTFGSGEGSEEIGIRIAKVRRRKRQKGRSSDASEVFSTEVFSTSTTSPAEIVVAVVVLARKRQAKHRKRQAKHRSDSKSSSREFGKREESSEAPEGDGRRAFFSLLVDLDLSFFVLCSFSCSQPSRRRRSSSSCYCFSRQVNCDNCSSRELRKRAER